MSFKVAILGVLFDQAQPLTRFSQGTPGPFKVELWMVDATAIRDLVEVDFIGAGQPLRYKFIPDGEFWFEKSLPVADLIPFIAHEYVEAVRMLTLAETYEVAHQEANKLEILLRQTRTEWENVDIITLLETILSKVTST